MLKFNGKLQRTTLFTVTQKQWIRINCSKALAHITCCTSVLTTLHLHSLQVFSQAP